MVEKLIKKLQYNVWVSSFPKQKPSQVNPLPSRIYIIPFHHTQQHILTNVLLHQKIIIYCWAAITLQSKLTGLWLCTLDKFISVENIKMLPKRSIVKWGSMPKPRMLNLLFVNMWGENYQSLIKIRIIALNMCWFF